LFDPAPKFEVRIGLPVPKLWLIFSNGVNRLGDLDPWPFDL